jgi:hypothetical protein
VSLFAGGINWPEELDLVFVDRDEGARNGKVREVHRKYVVDVEPGLSFQQGWRGIDNSRVATTIIDGEPAILRGQSGGDALHLSEIRIGSDALNQDYVAVRVKFELLASLSTIRHEDGAARGAEIAISLPPISSARAMALLLGTGGVAEIRSPDPAPLEEYASHLAAFQDLIVFAADQPAERVSLTGILVDGTEVSIHGWTRYPAFMSRGRQPVEYLLRFGADYFARAVDAWWRMRDEIRPVPQILASMIYEPWFLESSIGAVASAMERFTKLKFPPPTSPPRLTPQEFGVIEAPLLALLPTLNGAQRAFVNDIRNDGRRTRYEEYVGALLDSLQPGHMTATKINLANWKAALHVARNDIAHEGAPNPANPVLFVDEQESRALRDATRVILSLATLAHLDVPDPVLSRAAERLGVRYGVRHVDSAIYAP